MNFPNKSYLWTLAAIFAAGVILLFTSCSPFSHFTTPGGINPSDQNQSASVFAFLKGAPATVRAQAPGQPVAKAVAQIVHYCEWACALCLLAAGALGYFGQVIPAIKVGLAGIALIVFAKWFDYHYGIAIAFGLIAAAVGFFWAWNKNDPKQVAEITAKIKAELSGVASTIEKKI
jgi:hypothetical protein